MNALGVMHTSSSLSLSYRESGSVIVSVFNFWARKEDRY